jgi:hypothetical protein
MGSGAAAGCHPVPELMCGEGVQSGWSPVIVIFIGIVIDDVPEESGDSVLDWASAEDRRISITNRLNRNKRTTHSSCANN